MASIDPPISIALVGAGIGGLALAIGLAKQNVHCVVFESAPKFDAVGAGIGLGPNALKAMELMDEKFAKMYDDIKVGNSSPERIHEQFEILGAEEGLGTKSGWHGGSVSHPKFTRSSAHRRALLEVMEQLIPEGTLQFNKRVSRIDQSAGKVSLEFYDGTTYKFDVVIGCDGIKGITRKTVLGSRYPEEVASKYCNTYVYRGIAPMEEAKKIIGEYATDAKWFMQEGKGWAQYPITGGAELNIVAFIQDPNPWAGEQAVREVAREEMMSEFTGFDSRLIKLLDYVKPARWPLFHHPDTPTYYNGRICLLGDTAHASSPSQAAGAGQGLEDALILSKLLGLVKHSDEVENALCMYDSIRRPRAQSVVRESKDVGGIYFLNHPKFGADLQKITNDANRRLPLIWWHDLEADLKAAEDGFRALTGTLGRIETKAQPIVGALSVASIVDTV
ncbi:hypothetical protein EG327_011478 [Venturia inaequalis]|uniref:FAD-binding domain-containing protein n=1 Tax=Venturia inaequalis TaxID=5025 RepID=A0A8H3VNE9_VENIN|nr:hypothetical protein EG327_011478 [Venturia inaequalis]